MTQFELEPFLCSECGVDRRLNGAGHVVHEPDCSIGRDRERKRMDYWERMANLDRLTAEAKRINADQAKEREQRLTAPKGHQFIALVSGHHNPKNPDDWCWRITCECGFKDIAWSYDDAAQSRDDHRASAKPVAGQNGSRAATRPPKPPRAAAPVPSTTKPAQKPKRVIY